jgi:hypothetical protein
MRHRYRLHEQFQYVGLFLGLVGVLFVHPYVSGGRPDFILSILIAVIPAMAIVALVDDKRLMTIGLLLGVPATIVILRTGANAGSDLSQLSPLAFYFFATATICYHVITERRVSGDTLLGAICGYLMLGYTWAVAYAVLMSYDPNAFFEARAGAAADLNLQDLFYFSFVTLTTLGYGDILPISAKARSLAMMESVTGVLYLAVLVSRLVAMYGASPREQDRAALVQSSVPRINSEKNP